MGAFGHKPFENDDAADLSADVIEFIEKKYFNDEGNPKKTLSPEKLIALGEILYRLKDIGIAGLNKDLIGNLHDEIIAKHTNEYYKDWKRPALKRKMVSRTLAKLYKIMWH
jgi:hypothetical protein